jgi:putative ABC transport system permease protein
MLTNHLRLAWRTLTKSPIYALLNVGGLALGIAAAFVLGLYVRQELTYDQHFEDSDRIYRIATDFFNMGGFANSQAQLLDVLPQEAPIVDQATRLRGGSQPLAVTIGERTYEEPDYLFVDSAFFQVFSYRFGAGTPGMAMAGPDAVVLSETLAETYFGDAPAVGQTVRIGKEQKTYRVSGVVETPSGRSHLAAELWLPLELNESDARWTNVSYYNYVKLHEGATQADLERALDRILRQHAYPASGFAGPFEEWITTPQAVRFFIQPLEDIYLHSDFRFELAPGGNPTQVAVLGVIGALILLIAGMNYVNLTTARSSIRAKEVGVKKTLGAARPALVRQFLTETVALSVLAMLVAALLAEGMLAAFTVITGDVLVDGLFARGGPLLVLLGVSVGVGLAAGIYPALYLSGFRPVRILKGAWSPKGNVRLRSALVVVQFSIAIALIIGSLVIYRQLDFMLHTDKGFAHEDVVFVENADVLGEQVEAFRQQIEQLPQVRRTSLARRTPTGSGVAMYTYQTPAMEESTTLQTFAGDEDYIPTLGMQLIAGRNFSGDLASDSSTAILNESAVRTLGLGDDPLDKEINEGQRVIGVVRDFNFQSMRQQIEPVVLTYAPTGRHLLLKLDGHNIAEVIDRLDATWQQFAPAEPLRYTFLDDNVTRLAAKERTLGKAVAFFTLLSVLIACMGLFGLATFTAERRTKEIGVRKVLGASAASLVALLSKDFLKLVLVGLVVATPLAYVAMQRWLSDFAYRIHLDAGVFLLAGGLALLIAFLTVSYQAWRAATLDPVESLRYE